jgi:hypothetical protein
MLVLDNAPYPEKCRDFWQEWKRVYFVGDSWQRLNAGGDAKMLTMREGVHE